ncbi:hypothetical protein LCGC14_2085440 [marine sediment metagenome]|uniref:Uncharacterized protein n=1 Tax=marine sediment metagenome TaxID=412755 RepID=A0A0F9EE82_9ZZZZ
MKHWEFKIGLCYISFWVGLACADVGENYPSGKYHWFLPIAIAVAFTVPFVLGLNAGEKIKPIEGETE